MFSVYDNSQYSKLIKSFVLTIDSKNLLIFGGKVGSLYTSAIWHFTRKSKLWVKIGDMFQAASEVSALPVQGISC
jgi:hypothetical protein